MNKWRNYGLWAAIIAWIPVLADSLDVYNIDVILPGNWDVLTIGLLGILVLAGIISNPKEGKGFKDVKSKRPRL